MNKIPLHVKIVAGLVLGVLWAVLSGHLGLASFTANWIAPWGRIFINLLKLIAVPLILFSVVSGVASLGNPKELGRIGLSTIVLFISTSFLAVATGLGMGLLFKPGKQVDSLLLKENRLQYEQWCKTNNQITSDGVFMFLQNGDTLTTSGDYGVDARLGESAKARQNSTPLSFVEDLIPDNIVSAMSDNRNMLKIIVFGLFFGVAILYVPSDKTSVIRAFFDGGALIVMRMVELIMAGAPFFVFALMAGVINDMAGNDIGKVIEIFKGLGVYALSVAMGLLIVLLLLYPIYLKLMLGKISIVNFFRSIAPAQLLAFSSSSSAATLPVTLDCATQNLKISPQVSSFVLPIGATINMDGSSLYLAVAALFTAQLHMVDLSFMQMMIVMLTCLLGSIGAAAVPGAAVVMLMVVLSSVGLNPAWVAIVLPVDRILDMARTVVNVTGDLTVATIIDRRFFKS